MTAILSEFDRMVGEMVGKGIPRHMAESCAHRELGTAPKSELEKLRDAALEAEREDEVVDAGDRLVQALGFAVIRLSQKRASKVTAGVPDRYYVHVRRRLAVWWEAKGVDGRPRPDQLQFQALCRGAGVHHVLGGLEQLRAWLTTNHVASFDASGLPTPIPYDHA